MTPAEVDAVLALWREVEGTEPPRMVFAGAGYFIRPGDGAVIHDNDASDLICGHLRRWLEARCYRIDLTAVSDEARGLGLHPFEVKLVMKPSYAIVWRDGSTLLLALIAAVRAVAGTTGQPQTQGGASLRDANTTRTVFPGLGSATSYEVAGDLKRALTTGAAQMPGGQDGGPA